ncbi:hypothetical protein Tco_1311149 [Tanacetum coccineum]
MTESSSLYAELGLTESDTESDEEVPPVVKNSAPNEGQAGPNPVSKAVDEIVTDAIDWAMHAPLRERFRDLPEADIKEILHNRMWESKSYQTHDDHHGRCFEALEKFYDQITETSSYGPSGTSGALAASGSSNHHLLLHPTCQQSGGQSTWHLAPSPQRDELLMGDDTTVDEQAILISGVKTVESDLIPTCKLEQSRVVKPITSKSCATS